MSDINAAALSRDARKRSGLTQRELATRARTTQAGVARIEAGSTIPSLDTLRRLVDASGFDLRVEVKSRAPRDPVVEAFKPGVDQTLCIESLRRTPDQRLKTADSMMRFGVKADQAAGRRLRQSADVPRLLRALLGKHVEFIVVGGCAGALRGSAISTDDLDVVYSRTESNIAALVAALAKLKPWPRGAIVQLPYAWNEETVRRGLNLTLTTSAGAVDLIGELTGAGRFDSVLPLSSPLRLLGRDVRVLSVAGLIRAKRAVGRPRDFQAIAELELIQELQA